MKEGVGKGIVVEFRQLTDAGEIEGALSLNYLGVEQIRKDNTQKEKGDSYDVQKPMCVKEKENGEIRNTGIKDVRKEWDCSDRGSDKKTRTLMHDRTNIEGEADHRNELMVHKSTKGEWKGRASMYGDETLNHD